MPCGQACTIRTPLVHCSGLVSWLVVLAGVLMATHVVGVNIQPLLTVGGVSGVIVGLSAQSVMANMISGINLVSCSCQWTCTSSWNQCCWCISSCTSCLAVLHWSVISSTVCRQVKWQPLPRAVPEPAVCGGRPG